MNVVWYEGQRGRWDHHVLMTVFEKYPDKFIQHNEKDPPQADSAIVIVAGRPDTEPLFNYLNTIKSGVVILTSEEDAYFNWKALPTHLDVWTQYYSPSKEGINTRLLMGPAWPIKDNKIRNLEIKYLWSFVGQVQNPSRQACIDVLRTLPSKGYMHLVDAFGGQGNGIEYQPYLDIMCQSKYVICPSGSMSVDSFRLYEAMECGAIPITENRAPRDHKSFNYWREVYPENNLITVESWKELPGLLDPDRPVKNEWWFRYKDEFEAKLLELCN